MDEDSSHAATDDADDSSDWLRREYFALNSDVQQLDQRLMVVKGFGVTAGLAILAVGFESQHVGVFIVAIGAAVSFLVVECSLKRHQIRHYLRLREIEVLRAVEGTPQINWSWSNADDYFMGRKTGTLPPPERYELYHHAYRYPWLEWHVMLPHAITILLSVAMLLAVWSGNLEMKP